MKRLRILVADDHNIVRQGLVSLLQEIDQYEVVAEASDGLQAVQKALETRPDIAVIDLSMPRLSGIETVSRIHEKLPDTKVLVFTVHDEEEYIIPIIRAGASGYLIKDSAIVEVQRAMAALSSGQMYFGPQAAKVMAENYRNPDKIPQDPYGTLTPREREVFHLVIEGKTTKEIARLLGTSVKTSENHRARVMDKLDVHNTAELVRYAARKGLLP